MRDRRVGRSGLVVSQVGLGCLAFGWSLDEASTRRVVAAALDAGITLFDTSDNYANGASERLLGRALGARRADVVVATKFTMPGGRTGMHRSDASRRNIIRSCEESLQRLGTDWIDVFCLHHRDPETPMEETLDALDDLVHAGKVRYVGLSNLPSWQIADAEHIARARGLERFTSAQFEWSLLARSAEQEIVPACEHYGIGVMPYFPLASGMLTGKYRRGEQFPPGSRLAEVPAFAAYATPANFTVIERLDAYARQHGHTLLDLSMSWLACQPSVSSVLVGATKPEQVAANAAAAGWVLTADQLADVDALTSITDPESEPGGNGSATHIPTTTGGNQ